MDFFLIESSFRGAILLIGLSLLSVAIYRLFFHPLSKYPGPVWAKITDWYNVYHCFVGDRHLEFHRIHQKYGPIVRYGPNRVSINTATALKTIYSSKSNSQKSSHFDVFPKFFHSWSTQTIIDVEKFEHAQKRRAISKALHGIESKKYIEDVLLKYAEKFCGNIRKECGEGWSKAFNVSKVTSYMSFDIMGEVCFGKAFEMMEREENRYLLEVVSDGAQCLNTLGHMQKLLYTGLHRVLFTKLLKGLQRYQAYSKEQCVERIKNPSRCPDIFQALLSAKNTKTEQQLFTELELQSESSLLIIAGSDTTSTSLTATIFYLLHNPQCLEVVQQEILNTFETLDDIRFGPKLKECRYLFACITEALRMSPPVGGLMPRETLPGGMPVDGNYIPENIEVGTPHYTIHHNSFYYLDPFKFDPSRWISDDSEDSATRLALAESAFCAFSVGGRNCVGKSFAYDEMMIVLARMLWVFVMRLEPGSTLGGGRKELGRGRERTDEFQLWDCFASKSDGPMVQFKLRV
ncbi:cytochrome P450 [Halenospora varia]|nr:cytochrome P450 [Halenospora varia]